MHTYKVKLPHLADEITIQADYYQPNAGGVNFFKEELNNKADLMIASYYAVNSVVLDQTKVTRK